MSFKSLAFTSLLFLLAPQASHATNFICQSPEYGCTYQCSDESGACNAIKGASCPITGRMSRMSPYAETFHGYLAVFSSGIPDMVCQARNGSRTARGSYKSIRRSAYESDEAFLTARCEYSGGVWQPGTGNCETY